MRRRRDARDIGGKAAVIALLLFTVIPAGCADSGDPAPEAVRGVMDLRHWDFDRDGTIPLNGEWEFVAGALIPGREFDRLPQPYFIRVPSSWNDAEYDGRQLSPHGCASYRLKVLLGQRSDSLAFNMPKLVAYEVFVNGTQIGRCGKVGTSAAESEAEYRVQVLDALPVADTLDVVVWMSNFQYWKGGFWYSIVLGKSPDVHRAEEHALILDVITVTALAGFAVSMLIFFFYRKEERVTLYLAILCTIGIIRTISTGQLLVLQIVPDISWEWVVTIELFGFYMMGLGWKVIVYGLFPEELPARLLIILLALPIAGALLTLMTPVAFNSVLIPYMKFILMSMVLFVLYRVCVAAVRKRDGALLFAAVFAFNIFSVFMEMLYISNIIPIYVPSVLTVTIIVLALILMLARRYARAFHQVERFSEELEHRVEERTQELHAAQEQLLHREKLAALGQLTAGIAHEIKNPLNFVNNFAAVSRELIEELPEDVQSRPDVQPVLADLRSNLGRIHEHGVRADGIVQSMMLHAREGSRERRAMDLRILLDEAIDLAYHSARAQRPDFQAAFVKDFDETLPPVDVLPQDISRVFLNLLSNAIDAVHARAQASEDGYAGMITVSTRRDGDWAEVRIRDNGTGIPPEVRGRVFHPFFTTKPVGKGTGLGLSLSHDIITKAHGGSIALGPDGTEGAVFIIRLPISGVDGAGSALSATDVRDRVED